MSKEFSEGYAVLSSGMKFNCGSLSTYRAFKRPTELEPLRCEAWGVLVLMHSQVGEQHSL